LDATRPLVLASGFPFPFLRTLSGVFALGEAFTDFAFTVGLLDAVVFFTGLLFLTDTVVFPAAVFFAGFAAEGRDDFTFTSVGRATLLGATRDCARLASGSLIFCSLLKENLPRTARIYLAKCLIYNRLHADCQSTAAGVAKLCCPT